MKFLSKNWIIYLHYKCSNWNKSVNYNIINKKISIHLDDLICSFPNKTFEIIKFNKKSFILIINISKNYVYIYT